jgi:hypothetical protein
MSRPHAPESLGAMQRRRRGLALTIKGLAIGDPLRDPLARELLQLDSRIGRRHDAKPLADRVAAARRAIGEDSSR